MPNSSSATGPTLVFSSGTGIFDRAIECYRLGEEFFLYGVTQHGDARVLPSIGMARAVAASAMTCRPDNSSHSVLPRSWGRGS